MLNFASINKKLLDETLSFFNKNAERNKQQNPVG